MKFTVHYAKCPYCKKERRVWETKLVNDPALEYIRVNCLACGKTMFMWAERSTKFVAVKPPNHNDKKGGEE